MSLAILANADRPDETKDQLSVGSWEAFELPSQSFNYRKRRKKFLKLLLVPRLNVCLGEVSAKGDVTWDDLQRRLLAQLCVAMLAPCCNYSKQHCNNAVMLCCAKNRHCESSRVTSPYGM